MIKTLLIIFSIFSINMTLAMEEKSLLHSNSLTNSIDFPNTAAHNIMFNALSSLIELREQNKNTPENIQALIKTKLLPNISIEVATRATLKKHWHKLNKQQQQIFQQYIIKSLIKDYAGILGSYNKLNSLNISVDPKVKRRNNKAIVKLFVVLSKNSKPFKVVLKMIYSNQWYIYDVMFSGISLIKNYQAQFNSHIKRKSINSLIQKITDKLAKD